MSGRGKFTLNASLASDRARTQISGLGEAFEVTRIGDTLYVKGNHTFAARFSAVLGSKIPPNTSVKGPVTGPLKQVGSLVNLDSEIGSILGGRGALTKGANITVDGLPTIELNQAHQLYTAKLYIATTGAPTRSDSSRPDRSTAKQSSQTGTALSMWIHHAMR